MCAMSVDEASGLDLEWLACDASGHVAVLFTCGGGKMPESVLRAYDATYLDALDSLRLLPVRGAPLVDAPRDVDGLWAALAERGFHGYDGDLHGPSYQRIFVPSSPILLQELPAPARSLAGLACLPVRFGDNFILRI